MNLTKQKIIAVATDLFVEKGYSGTSISEIAKLAEINQSLIYHHIGNKSDLWKMVKQSMIREGFTPSQKQSNSLQEFLQKAVHERISLYSADPRMSRLMQWQSLEGNAEDIQGGTTVNPFDWLNDIKHLQSLGEIKKDYPASFITSYIYSLVNGVCNGFWNIFQEADSSGEMQKQYISLLEKSITELFKN
jgi:hypothetical protein